MSRLLIVESPTKAKTITKMLGRDYRITASMGHVRDLPEHEFGVDLEHDFKPQYVDTARSRNVIKELKTAAKAADEIYLASDPDREGEAIAWHLREVLKKSTGAPFYRVTFHEITRNAIEKAIQEKGDIDLRRVDAQQARRVLDRIVGYQVSSLLWKRLEKGSSAGRVQSVALRLVVERERAIQNFIPEEYWTLALDFTTATGEHRTFSARLFKIDGKEHRLPDKTAVDALLAVLRNGSAPEVASVSRTSRQRYAPPPFTTSTLQQTANTVLHYSATSTMRCAQQLYEGITLGDAGSTGLITYMRTDSVNIAREAQQAAREFITETYGPQFVPGVPNHFKSKGIAQEAHEAIRPTDVRRTPESVAPFLDASQLKLYTLIWKRFVASQMSPAVQDLTAVDVGITAADGRKCTFRATASVPKFAGFTTLFNDEKKADAKAEDARNAAVLGTLCEHDPLTIAKVTPDQKFTEPPPRFSEAALIKELEENGIGRPSTYATILKTIQDREYVSRTEGKLVPSELGYSVCDFLVGRLPELFDIGFTASMEEKLDEIEEGKLPWVKMMHDFYDAFAPWIDNAKKADAVPEDDAAKIIELVSDLQYEPPQKTGRKLFDDAKFVSSLREKFDRDRTLSARQFEALISMAAKYRTQLPVALLEQLPENIRRSIEERGEVRAARAAAANAPQLDCAPLFAAFDKVDFESPVKRGRTTYDDKKFFESLKKQAIDQGKPLSEKQLAALKKLAAKYQVALALPGEPGLPAAAPAPQELRSLFDAFNGVSFEPPVKRGRFTYDDKKFFESLKKQAIDQGKALSEKQLAALNKLAARYLGHNDPAAPAVAPATETENEASPSPAPALPAEEQNACAAHLAFLATVKNWAEPVKRGRFTYDDKSFCESLAKQFASGKTLSEKQRAALAKLVEKYRKENVK